MAEKERKNVLEVRNHTDRVVSFLMRLLKRKNNVAFRPQSSSYRVSLITAGYRRIPQDPFIWTFLMEFSMIKSFYN